MPQRGTKRQRVSEEKHGGQVARRSSYRLPRSLPFDRVKRWHTRYAEYQISLDPGVAGIMASHLFAWNGLYDPDITGVGHQPIGFDQLVGVMYDHYQVVRARAMVTFSNQETSYQQVVTLSTQDTTTVSETLPTPLIENGRCKWAVLGVRDAGDSTKTLRINWDSREFFGSTSSDDQYKGNSSSNPTDIAYLRLTAAPQNAADTTNVRALVVIEYDCLLTSPKQIAQS